MARPLPTTATTSRAAPPISRGEPPPVGPRRLPGHDRSPLCGPRRTAAFSGSGALSVPPIGIGVSPSAARDVLAPVVGSGEVGMAALTLEMKLEEIARADRRYALEAYQFVF